MSVCVYEPPGANNIMLVILHELNAFLFSFETGIVQYTDG